MDDTHPVNASDAFLCLSGLEGGMAKVHPDHVARLCLVMWVGQEAILRVVA